MSSERRRLFRQGSKLVMQADLNNLVGDIDLLNSDAELFKSRLKKTREGQQTDGHG